MQTKKIFALLFSCYAANAISAPLDKYSAPSRPFKSEHTLQQREPINIPASNRMSLKILEEQSRALKALQAQPKATQQAWIEAFKNKEKEAADSGNYDAAKYYNGIIRQWSQQNHGE